MHSRLHLEDRKIFNHRIKRHCLFCFCLCIILSTGVKCARPPVWKFLRMYFWKYRLHNMHKLYCNQHAMFKICILFSTITVKVNEHQNNLQTSRIIPGTFDLIIVWRFVVMLNIENLKFSEHQAFNIKRKVGYVQLWTFCWNKDVCWFFFLFFSPYM